MSTLGPRLYCSLYGARQANKTAKRSASPLLHHQPPLPREPRTSLPTPPTHTTTHSAHAPRGLRPRTREPPRREVTTRGAARHGHPPLRTARRPPCPRPVAGWRRRQRCTSAASAASARLAERSLASVRSSPSPCRVAAVVVQSAPKLEPTKPHEPALHPRKPAVHRRSQRKLPG